MSDKNILLSFKSAAPFWSSILFAISLWISFIIQGWAILIVPVFTLLILPIIDQYDAVICGDDEYTEAVILRGAQGSLKYISKYGVGLDKIELEVAKKYNIPVTNCPGINYTSVAEHVLALLFTFEKNVHLQYNSTRQGSWKRWVGHEISGKTIGIIGLGAIGKELTKKSLASSWRLRKDGMATREAADLHGSRGAEMVVRWLLSPTTTSRLRVRC